MKMLVLAAVLLAVIPDAHAAGKNPRDAKQEVTYLIPEPVTAPGQIAAWLRQLVGRYRAEGMVWMPEFDELDLHPEPLRGGADCMAIGTGAGLHCIFDISWLDIFEAMGRYNLPGGIAYLSPAMMLVGLDPGHQGITFLLVDHKGLPEGGAGSIAGQRATLRAPCVNAPNLFLSMDPARRYDGRPPQTCERITRIDARGRLVNMVIHIEINGELATSIDVTLWRLPADDPNPGRRRR